MRNRQITGPNDNNERNAERDWLMERWHEYGRDFSVFVLEQQPAPEVWEPERTTPDEKADSTLRC